MKTSFLSFLFFLSLFSQAQLPSDAQMLEAIFGQVDDDQMTYSEDFSVGNYFDSLHYQVVFSQGFVLGTDTMLLAVVESPCYKINGETVGYRHWMYLQPDADSVWQQVAGIMDYAMLSLSDPGSFSMKVVDTSHVFVTYESTSVLDGVEESELFVLQLTPEKEQDLGSFDLAFSNRAQVEAMEPEDRMDGFCQIMHFDSDWTWQQGDEEVPHIFIDKMAYAYTADCTEILDSKAMPETWVFDGEAFVDSRDLK